MTKKMMKKMMKKRLSRWPGYISADDLRAFPGVFHSPVASGPEIDAKE